MTRRARAVALVVGAAFRADPGRATLVAVLAPALGLTTAAIALELKLLADAVVGSRPVAAFVVAAALSLTAIADRVFEIGLGKLRFRLQEATGLRLEHRLVELVGGIPGLEHHERPEFLDRVEHLRTERQTLGHAVGVVATSWLVAAEAVGTLLLLASVHPSLLVLPLFGVPSLVASGKAAGLLDAAGIANAEQSRLATHYLTAATSLGTAKELRLFGLQDEIRRRHRNLLQHIGETKEQARRRGVIWRSSASLTFGLAYLGALAFVAHRAAAGLATAGDVFLAVTLASRVDASLKQTTTMASELQSVLLLAGHFLWLEDYANRTSWGRPSERQLPAPRRLWHGIALDNVSFRYPATDRDVLHDVNLLLPAGSVVALVGENGAGKTTLVKLLCGFYPPTSGTISLDGVDLSECHVDSWRARTSAAFQDYCKFEFTAQEAIGVGDVTAVEDQRRVRRAADQAGATVVLQTLPEDLATQLGRTFGGVDLSEGQWQKLALARARMRPHPLLYILDEPTAALDAASEHALFSHVTQLAREAASNGAITVLVSHRLSTVQDADLIVVLAQGKVVEVGTHRELLAARRLYAELFALQARAYQ